MNRQELVEKMLDGDFKGRGQNYDWRTCGSASEDWFKGMDAALSVAIDELLEPMFPNEWDAHLHKSDVQNPNNMPTAIASRVLASRRAKLERVKTPEERVTVEALQNGAQVTPKYVYWHVLVDGVRRPDSLSIFGHKPDAEIYRLGLIQQLKDSNGR